MSCIGRRRHGESYFYLPKTRRKWGEFSASYCVCSWHHLSACAFTQNAHSTVDLWSFEFLPDMFTNHGIYRMDWARKFHDVAEKKKQNDAVIGFLTFRILCILKIHSNLMNMIKSMWTIAFALIENRPWPLYARNVISVPFNFKWNIFHIWW